MNALATPAQLAAYLGRTIADDDPRALAHLQQASDVFRSLASQTISEVSDDEVELFGTWRHGLWLPERPVTDVSEVSIRDAEGFTITLDDDNLVISRRGLLIRLDRCDWCGPDATVYLTYDHGYTEIPGDVMAVVLGMASRAFSNPRGAISRSIGTFSETLASGSSAGLTAQELSVVRKYRPRS